MVPAMVCVWLLGVQQFLKQQGYSKSVAALEQESGLCLYRCAIRS